MLCLGNGEEREWIMEGDSYGRKWIMERDSYRRNWMMKRVMRRCGHRLMEEGVVCYADKGGIIGGESQNRKEELEQIIEGKKGTAEPQEKHKEKIEYFGIKETEKSQKFTVEKEGNSYRKRV